VEQELITPLDWPFSATFLRISIGFMPALITCPEISHRLHFIFMAFPGKSRVKSSPHSIEMTV